MSLRNIYLVLYDLQRVGDTFGLPVIKILFSEHLKEASKTTESLIFNKRIKTELSDKNLEKIFDYSIYKKCNCFLISSEGDIFTDTTIDDSIYYFTEFLNNLFRKSKRGKPFFEFNTNGKHLLEHLKIDDFRTMCNKNKVKINLNIDKEDIDKPIYFKELFKKLESFFIQFNIRIEYVSKENDKIINFIERSELNKNNLNIVIPNEIKDSYIIYETMSFCLENGFKFSLNYRYKF